MPWQRQVADVAFELDPETGLLAYREIVLTIMRQHGKTTLVLAVEVDRCLAWQRHQRVVYTAQTGQDARKKLIEDQVPVLGDSPLWGAVDRVYEAAANEQIRFRNGSKIGLSASSVGAGHGRTIDVGVIDEAWEDEDDRREQALLPAMVTVADAQLWVPSNGGTKLSVYLKRKVEAGRHAAMADPGRGTAYFEWSIPLEEDHTDPAVWWARMPALGWTITEAAVAHAQETMEDNEFRRAFGNQWTEDTSDRVISEDLWRAVCHPRAKPSGRPRFGLDIAHDRSSAAIVGAGGGAAELLEHHSGVSWVTERAKALHRRWKGPIVIDGGGPAAGIADELEREKVKVERLQGAAVVAACGRIYDAIADATIKVRTSGRLDAAAGAVRKKPVGDRFVWTRAASAGDITPFFALTLALASSGSSRKPLVAST
ncbi:MAG: hypothetical protein ACRDH9_09305 [Actinomycetota bacterium]